MSNDDLPVCRLCGSVPKASHLVAGSLLRSCRYEPGIQFPHIMETIQGGVHAMLINTPGGHSTAKMMPARPLCFGMRHYYHQFPMGMPCFVPCEHQQTCRDEGIHLPKWCNQARINEALLRIYIRVAHELRAENAAMRERVDVLEWLAECIDGSRRAHRNGALNGWPNQREDAYLEMCATLAHARKEAGV